MVTLTSVSLLVIFALISGLILPSLLKNFNGMKRMVIVAQQISVLVYLSLSILRVYLDVKFRRSFDTFHSFLTDEHLSIHILLPKTVEFFQMFAYCEYYFASMMFSLDVYMTVCHPLIYKEKFCKTKKIIKIMLTGALACFIFNIDLDYLKF